MNNPTTRNENPHGALIVPDCAIKIKNKVYWLDGFFVCIEKSYRYIVRDSDSHLKPVKSADLIARYRKYEETSQDTYEFFKDTREVYMLNPGSRLFEFGFKMNEFHIVKEGEGWKMANEKTSGAVKAYGIAFHKTFEINGKKIKKHIVKLSNGNDVYIRYNLSPTGYSHRKTSDILDQDFGDIDGIFSDGQLDLWIESMGNYSDLVYECQCIFTELRRFRVENRGSMVFELVSDFHNVNAKRRSACKVVQPSTAKSYGQLFAPFYIMLVHFRKFRFYDDYRETVDMLFNGIDIDLLEKDIGLARKFKLRTAEYLELIKKKCWVIHQMIDAMIDNPEATMFFQIMLKHSCIKLTEKKVQKADFQRVTTTQARSLLDSIKLLLKYALVYNDHFYGVKKLNSLSVDREAGDGTPWDYTRKLYSAIVHQMDVMGAYTVNSVSPGEYLINEKYFSIDGVNHLYNTSIDKYRKRCSDLMTHVGCTNTIEWTYNQVTNYLKSSGDGRWMFADLFGSEATKDKFEFGVAEAVIHDHVLDSINSMTMNLVLAVYIVTGMKMRFTELTNLALTDNFAAVRIERKSNLIYLVNGHNKGPEMKKNILFTNETVSQLLYHYILVIKPLQMYILNKYRPEYICVKSSEIDMANRVQLRDQDDNGEEEDSDDDSDLELDNLDEIESPESSSFVAHGDIPSKVQRMYLFVTVEKHITFPSHKAMARTFKNNKKRHESDGSVRLYRQLGVQLSREAEILMNQTHMERKGDLAEMSAGHSVATGAMNYGVNQHLPAGVTPLDMAIMRGSAENYWTLLSLSKRGTIKASIKVMPITPHLDVEDVEGCGRKIFGEGFQFKSKEQLSATCALITSRLKHVAIQAPTGFGKTEVFLLPILAIENMHPRTFLNIVMVPYLPLKFNMFNRFVGQNIRVGKLENLVRDIMNSDMQTIYVGIWDDALIDEVKITLEKFSARQRLGYLVLDEYHTIAKDSSFRGPAAAAVLEMVSIESWLRVAMMSATLQSSDTHEFLGISPSLIRSKNYIVNLPHENRIFLKTDTVSNHTSSEVTERLKAFMNICGGKCIVLFSKKAVMDAAFDHFKVNCPEVQKILVCGDDSSEVKARAMLEFSTVEGQYVMFGTKLLTHGIDSNDVQLVIMVDFFKGENDTEDVIQSIGRVRKKGIVNFLTTAEDSEKGNSEPGEEKCFSREVSKYYFPEIEQPEHNTCCSLYHIRDDELHELAEQYTNQPLTIETADGFVERPEFEIPNEDLRKVLLEKESPHCLFSKENLRAISCLIEQATDDCQSCSICLRKCTRRKRCHVSQGLAEKCLLILVVTGKLKQDEIKSILKKTDYYTTTDLIRMAAEHVDHFMQYHTLLSQDMGVTCNIEPLDLQAGTDLFKNRCDIARLLFLYQERQINVSNTESERRKSYWEYYAKNHRLLDLHRNDSNFIFSYEMMNHLSTAFLNAGHRGLSELNEDLFYGGGKEEENIRYTLGLALHFMFFNETVKDKVLYHLGDFQIHDSFTWMTLMNQKLSDKGDYYFYHLAFAQYNMIYALHSESQAEKRQDLMNSKAHPMKTADVILDWVKQLVDRRVCVASYCIKGVVIEGSFTHGDLTQRSMASRNWPYIGEKIKKIDLLMQITTNRCFRCLVGDHFSSQCSYEYRNWIRFIYYCCFFNHDIQERFKVDDFQVWTDKLMSSSGESLVAVFSCLMDFAKNFPIPSKDVESDYTLICSDPVSDDTVVAVEKRRRSIGADYSAGSLSTHSQDSSEAGLSTFKRPKPNTTKSPQDTPKDIEKAEKAKSYIQDLIRGKACVAALCILLEYKVDEKFYSDMGDAFSEKRFQMHIPRFSAIGGVDLCKNVEKVYQVKLDTDKICFTCYSRSHRSASCRQVKYLFKFIYYCCYFNKDILRDVGCENLTLDKWIRKAGERCGDALFFDFVCYRLVRLFEKNKQAKYNQYIINSKYICK